MQPHGFGQPIAQLAQIARGAAPRHHPAKRAAQIGDRAQAIAQLRAFNRAIAPELHQRQPCFDRSDIQQRGRQVFGQQARSCAGYAAIHRADQAAVAPSRGGFEDFEAGARRLIHRHPSLGGAPYRG